MVVLVPRSGEICIDVGSNLNAAHRSHVSPFYHTTICEDRMGSERLTWVLRPSSNEIISPQYSPGRPHRVVILWSVTYDFGCNSHGVASKSRLHNNIIVALSSTSGGHVATRSQLSRPIVSALRRVYTRVRTLIPDERITCALICLSSRDLRTDFTATTRTRAGSCPCTDAVLVSMLLNILQAICK